MTHQPRQRPEPPPAPYQQPWRPGSTTHRARTIPGRLLPALAAALALALTSGTALTASATGQPTGSGGWSPTDSAGRHARFVDKHGQVLTSPQLYLIYWGTLWRPYTAAEPTAAQVTAAVHTLLHSAYLTGLTQYRSGRGSLRGSALVTTSDPPDGFTDDQVAHFLDAQLTAGTVPGPDPDNQTVYGVVMPTGITAELARRAEHAYFTRSGQPIHYAWFTNVGDQDSITELISHELVEAATDPEGSGFLGVNGTCNEPGWCEIADVCESLSVLDGVTVQAYWSNQYNACVVPGGAAPNHPSGSGEAHGDPERPGTAIPPGHSAPGPVTGQPR